MVSFPCTKNAATETGRRREAAGAVPTQALYTVATCICDGEESFARWPAVYFGVNVEKYLNYIFTIVILPLICLFSWTVLPT